jgi:hypothetical protein
MSKRKVKEVNFLELVPRKSREWEIEDNRVIVLVPKFDSRISRWLLRFMREPNFKIKLDKYSAFVWKEINGKRNIEKIGLRFKENFGEEIEPLFDRLLIFFRKMENQKLVDYEK